MNRGFLLIAVAAISFASCKPMKKTAANKTANDTVAAQVQPAPMDTVAAEPLVTLVEPPPARTDRFTFLSPLWSNGTDFKTFAGKAKMSYEASGIAQDFTANIRIAKDSIIWIHITAGMGLVNVARIYITPDSLQMVNYLQRTALKIPAGEANQLLPADVDFATLQNFIIGGALNRNGWVTNVQDAGSVWNILMADRQVQMELSYNKADSTLNTQQVMSAQDEGFRAIIRYAGYAMVNNRKFATSRGVQLTDNSGVHVVSMNFNHAGFDEDIEFPFNIPQSYSQAQSMR